MLSYYAAQLFLLLAQAAPPEGGEGPPPEPAAPAPSMLPQLLIFGAIFFLMYLFVFRPQSQKDKEEKSMLDRLKKDDHVVTKGGLYGVVVNLRDDEVTLRVDENNNTKLRFQKSAIAAILDGNDKSSDGKKS